MKRQPGTYLVTAIAIALLSGSSIFVYGQKPHKPRRVQVSKTRKESTIEARAGDSLKSIADRLGINATQLARLNGLALSSKLKIGQKIIIPTPAASEAAIPQGAGDPNGQLITFVDGGSLHVDEAWWKGEEVWYRRGKVTETSRRKVKSIEPVFVAQVKDRNVAEAPPLRSVADPAAAAPASFWIYLVGGARFKVDEVNKTSDGAWYQRGNLMSFLASNRIERIERETPGSAAPDWKEADWTSGNHSIDQSIRTYGGRFGVDPYLVFLVIEQESHFRTRVVSPKGARGLMQLMPGTARRFGVRNSFDPAENIRGGTQYLKELLTMFNGRVDLALASYNAGEGRVIGYGNKVPPFQETQDYVRKIGQRYKKGSSSQKDSRKASGRTTQPALAEEMP